MRQTKKNHICNTGKPPVTTLHFIVLCRYCHFYKSDVCGTLAPSKSIRTTLPTAFARFLSLCHILIILTIFHIFLRLKKDYYICCSDLCSAIFEVIIKMEGGQTAPRWEDELNKCVCSDCSTDWQLPSSLPLLQPLYSLRHNTGIRPINNLTEASKYSNERRSPTSLTWNQKLEIIKLTEEGKSKA